MPGRHRESIELAEAAPTPVKQNYQYDADGNLTEAYVVGDMNCDAVLNGFDIDPFVVLLTGG